MLLFERFYYQTHPIICQRYEAVNFFIIHSFEEQFKNLEVHCQNLHIPLILQYFSDKIA